MAEHLAACGWNVDLLGDPIPDGFGGRGRPPHLPTQENRNKVMVLQAIGWPPAKIAAALAITPPTLRKHYFRELRDRDHARARVEALALTALVRKVQAGDTSAIGLLYKRLDRTAEQDARPVAGRPPRLGKKEQALVDAHEAGADTEWSGLLN